MYWHKVLLSTVVLLFVMGISSAQGQHTITGTVTDGSSGAPLPGVNISVKKAEGGTATDANGQYELQAPSSEGTLIFSFVGYQTREVPIRGRQEINVALQPTVLSREELVVTGYQQQERGDITGSVSSVNPQKVQSVNSADLTQSLEGRVAGLDVQSSGAPGGGDARIRIRGYSTLGNQDPLFIVDGVPTQEGIRTLNPRDIESVEVLKDAAAASIYGARAANGVVLITTKKGDDELDVTFDSYVGVQQVNSEDITLNARQWGEVWFRAQRNSGVSDPQHPQYTFEQTENGVKAVPDDFIDNNPDDGDVIRSGDTNWFDVVFDPAIEQSYNLSMSKGTEDANVAATASYFRQGGTMRTTSFDRYTFRVNSDYQITDDITIGENMTLDNHNEVRMFQGFTREALFQHPLVPVFKETPEDEFAGPTDGLGDRLNPLGELKRNEDNIFRNWRIFGNAFLEATPFETLELRSSIGIDYTNTFQREFSPRFDEGTQRNVTNDLTTFNSWGFDWTWTGTATYSHEVGNHSYEVVGGGELISQFSQSLSGRREEFFINNDRDFQFLNAGSGVQTNSGGGTEASLFSLFGKADYNYASKYLASFTIRRDQSSRLGPANDSKVFPAFSLGWRLSNESFFDVGAVNDLKFRFSWGQTGGQGIGDFAAFSTFAFDPEFSIIDLTGSQTSAETGFFRSTIGNQNLGWETSTEINFGVDLSLFQDRFSFSADYFDKDTEKLLLQPQRLAAQGEGSPPFVNAGEINNKGVEIAMEYTDNLTEDLNLSVRGTITSIQNEVVSLTEGREFLVGQAGIGRVQPGHATNEFFGWVFGGLFQNEEEVENHADQGFTNPSQGVGRMRFRDLNDDGVIDEADRTFIGNPHPTATFGLNLDVSYSNWHLSVLLKGEQGKDVYNEARELLDFPTFNFNFGDNTLDAWTPENRDTNIPRLNSSDINDERRTSSYFVEDGSFIKVDELSLGYTLPDNISERIMSDNVRLYIRASNVWTLTGYSGIDPDFGAQNVFNLGIDESFFPHPRKISVGFTLNY